MWCATDICGRRQMHAHGNLMGKCKSKWILGRPTYILGGKS